MDPTHMNSLNSAGIDALGRAATHAWAWTQTHLITLEGLAWIIGALNPISAVLVGPALAYALRRRPRLATRLQGTGWLTLALAQTAFLTFGWISGYGGFRWAQALMIPAAAANFALWWITRRRDPLEHLLTLAYQLEATGRIHITHRTDLTPDIPTTRTELYARALRITKLDEHGKPIPGATYDLTGPTQPPEHPEDIRPGPIRMSFTTETPPDLEALRQAFGAPHPRRIYQKRHQPPTDPVCPNSPYGGPTCGCPTAFQCRTSDDLPHLPDGTPSATDGRPNPTDGSTPVVDPVDQGEEQCPGPVWSHLGSPPERCADRAGHPGDCVP